MAKVTQFTVSVENRPGTLAQVARCLGNEGVNILGFLTGTVGAAGYAQVTVDDTAKAKTALDREKLPYMEQTVLQTEIPNKPGALAEFAGRLAEKNINITSAFASTVAGAASGCVILATSDLEQAAQIQPVTVTTGTA